MSLFAMMTLRKCSQLLVKSGLRRPLLSAVLAGLACHFSFAGTTVFFDASQVATPAGSETTSDTIASEGYLFTLTRDKLFTGGIGLTNPIGRTVRVPWPQGVEAQAVTAGPTPGGARIVLKRVDGRPFDLTAFTARLLANTAATGASIEIMPSLNGEDAFNDPVYFNASGYYGSEFSYDLAPNHLGSTASLTNFESYTLKLFVDYALTALTVEMNQELPPLPLLVLTAHHALGGTNVTSLTWTNSGTTCLLESTDDLAGLWRMVTSSWQTNGNWISTEATTTNTVRFFRLRGL